MNSKIILAGLAILGSIELSAYTYEVNPLAGKNFTESGSIVKDSAAYGIRLNKYISKDNAIMFGYTRLNGVNYKNRKTSYKVARSCDTGCEEPTPVNDACYTGCEETTPVNNSCDTGCGNNGNIDTGSNNIPGTNTGSGSNNIPGTNTGSGSNNIPGTNTGSGSNNIPGSNTGSTSSTPGGTQPGGNTAPGTTPGGTVHLLGSSSASKTDINRFYLNGLHNIHTGYSRLTPYVYGGFGYEHVSNEYLNNGSQGFFNAGGGLKFNISDRLNILADVQGIKKFSNHDLDILGSVGVGFMFGDNIQPTPSNVVDSGLEDRLPVAPQPTRDLTVVEVAPQAVAVEPIVEDKPAYTHGQYYIQIAAGFKTDMETGCKHTKELRDAGIDYDIKYTTIKGKNVALVVVGPYETSAAAKSHLDEMRVYSKDAFVKKIAN